VPHAVSPGVAGILVGLYHSGMRALMYSENLVHTTTEMAKDGTLAAWQCIIKEWGSLGMENRVDCIRFSESIRDSKRLCAALYALETVGVGFTRVMGYADRSTTSWWVTNDLVLNAKIQNVVDAFEHVKTTIHTYEDFFIFAQEAGV
jgi:hypothetical protein